MHDIVTLTNYHPDKTYNLDHLGRRYTLTPGDSKMVPYELAVSVLGDPNLANQGRNTERRDAYDRLIRYWGVHVGFDDDATVAAKMPRLKVTDEDGYEVIMLIHDPDQQAVQQSALANASPADYATQGPDRIAALEAQNAALQNQLGRVLQLLEGRLPGVVPTPVAPDAPLPVEFNVGTMTPEESARIQAAVNQAAAANDTQPAEGNGTVGAALGVQEIPEPQPGSGATVDSPNPGGPRPARPPRAAR